MAFDFEKPITEIQEQIENARKIAEKGKVDMTAAIAELETKLEQTRHQVYENLNGWQRVQMSRHPERPYSLDYINLAGIQRGR